MTKDEIKNITISFFSAILIAMSGWIIYTICIGQPYLSSPYVGVPGFLNPLTLNDSEWYLKIANEGYTSPFLYAFFPLYPMIIGSLGNLTGINPLYFGILINWGLFYLSGLMFISLLSEKTVSLAALCSF